MCHPWFSLMFPGSFSGFHLSSLTATFSVIITRGRPPQRIATLSWWGGLGAPVTLGAVLSGALAPGRVSQGKVVPGEGPD